MFQTLFSPALVIPIVVVCGLHALSERAPANPPQVKSVLMGRESVKVRVLFLANDMTFGRWLSLVASALA